MVGIKDKNNTVDESTDRCHVGYGFWILNVLHIQDIEQYSVFRLDSMTDLMFRLPLSAQQPEQVLFRWNLVKVQSYFVKQKEDTSTKLTRYN